LTKNLGGSDHRTPLSPFGATSASDAWIFDLPQPEQQTVDDSRAEIDVALNDFPGSAEIAA